MKRRKLFQNKREKIEEWMLTAPNSVIFLVRVLKFILDQGGFVVLIIGGIGMLISLWQVIKGIRENGWNAILDWSTLNVIVYFAVMRVINETRVFLYRILHKR